MKTCLCALALAAIVGSAQAVTMNWTKIADGVTTAGSVDSLGVWADRSATYAATITYGATLGTGTVLSIGRDGSSNIFSATLDASGNYTLTVDGATAGTSTAGTTVAAKAGASQIVALSFYRSAGNVMKTVELSVDGVVVMTLSDYAITTGPMNWAEWGRKVGNVDAYTGSATYNAWLTNGDRNSALMDAVAIKNDIASLPEPTALALLALGVAGLALRRKVA